MLPHRGLHHSKNTAFRPEFPSRPPFSGSRTGSLQQQRAASSSNEFYITSDLSALADAGMTEALTLEDGYLSPDLSPYPRG